MTGLSHPDRSRWARENFFPDIVEDKKKKKADKWQKLTEAFFTLLFMMFIKAEISAIHELGHFSSPYGSYTKKTT